MHKHVKKTEIRAFLHAVNFCTDEVWFCTEDGDRLALKSQLNKIMFLALMTGKDQLSSGEYFIEYNECDQACLESYLEPYSE